MNSAVPVGLPNKHLVAASFSRAAASYDAVAQVQRAVGIRLLEQLPRSLDVQRWLDVGCGTGYFSCALAQRFPASCGMALDIAQGMLQYARERGAAEYFIAGDAEALPLVENSQSLVFSSLALQWCADFAQVLSEAQRVLKVGGVLAFSSLVQGSLQELRDSWRMVDGHVHVNQFRAFTTYQQLCADSELEVLSLQVEPQVMHFADLRSLTRSLKDVGAHNLNQGRADGLTSRQRLTQLRAAYEAYREPAGLPLTYQVVYGVLRKRQV